METKYPSRRNSPTAAMPNGREMIVSTRREGASECIRVADTASGMTDEQLRQVFVPFFTSKSEAGAGELGGTSAKSFSNPKRCQASHNTAKPPRPI